MTNMPDRVEKYIFCRKSLLSFLVLHPTPWANCCGDADCFQMVRMLCSNLHFLGWLVVLKPFPISFSKNNENCWFFELKLKWSFCFTHLFCELRPFLTISSCFFRDTPAFLRIGVAKSILKQLFPSICWIRRNISAKRELGTSIILRMHFDRSLIWPATNPKKVNKITFSHTPNFGLPCFWAEKRTVRLIRSKQEEILTKKNEEQLLSKSRL